MFFQPGSLYPLELVKTRMQVAGEQQKVYRSMIQSSKTIFKNERIKGFYQGVTPALFAASGSWGGYFLAYESSKQRKLSGRLDGSQLGGVDHVSVLLCCHTRYDVVSAPVGRGSGRGHGHAVQPRVGGQNAPRAAGRRPQPKAQVLRTHR